MQEITSIEQLKLIELEIALKIKEFCNINGIHYYLSHGTLLGAVRHKGFIPWDDDMDIFMFRPDYEKFCKYFPQSENAYNLELVNSHTKTYYGRPISKVIDSRTIVYEPIYLKDDPIGVFVDIWPLDGLPHKGIKRNFHLGLNYILNRMYMCRIRTFASLSLGGKILHALSCIISPKWLLDIIEKLEKKYDVNFSDEVICYSDTYKKALRREWFEIETEGEFEKQIFNIPNGYDKVLKVLYGDYLTLPPEDQQIPHHIMNTYWK